MEKFTTGLLLGLMIGLILGGITGYFINSYFNRGPRIGNFEIDKNTKNEINTFFESTSDINEINSYCTENRMYCSYYCREINTEHEICNKLQNPNLKGAPPQ